MLKPKVLSEVLAEANTGGIISTMYVIFFSVFVLFLTFLKCYTSSSSASVRLLELLHFRTPPPPFLLMTLVQNFMLIKNHIETWV